MLTQSRVFRPHGLTFLEIMFGFLIVSVLLSLTTVSLRGSIRQEGSRGLAYALAEDLRAARADAQGSGVPVAFCFPTDEGENPFCCSFMALKGEQRGRFSRAHNYAGEFEGAIFIGEWPGASTATEPLPGAWHSSVSGQAAIFFRPDGTAFSNEIPLVDGRYPLVVGSAFRLSSNGELGLPTIDAVSNPYTVSVSPAGTIRVEDRVVPGAPLPQALELPSPAAPDLEAPRAEGMPTILSVTTLPERTEGFSEVRMPKRL